MRRWFIAAAVAAVLAATGGCAGGGAAESGGGEVRGAAEAPARDAAADGGEAAMGGGGDRSATGGAPAAVLAADVTERIVRNGTMQVQVDDGGFDRALDRLVGLADQYGGTVLSSDASTRTDGTTAGSVTIRVPADDYDALLVAVGGIGDVQQRSITSKDVSDEYVDLEARLRHNRAQERFYLSLLDRATDVEDAIAVQQRMDDIQLTIEQLQGRLRFLDERTSFSRLTVELAEAGASFEPGGTTQPSFARYWATARAALVTVLGGTLVVATVALPFLVGGLLLVLIVRRLGPVRRRVATPDS